MDYAALAVEIALPAYDGLSDATIAAALNAKTVAGPDRLVPVVEITTYLRSNNLWLAIADAAAAKTNDGARAALDYNNDPRTVTLDVSLAIVGAMLEELVSGSLLTQEQADTIAAMKATTRPWWSSVGAEAPLNEFDIARARAI